MYVDFDLHSAVGRIALRWAGCRGERRVELRRWTGESLGELGHNLLPHIVRWSPDGTRLAFSSNEGQLYATDEQFVSQLVFDEPSRQAGFCEWSGDCSSLVFSAYGRYDMQPPQIYRLALLTSEVAPLTAGDEWADRFPQPSPCGRFVAFQRQLISEQGAPSHVCVVEVESKRCLQLSDLPGFSTHVARFCWSADSGHLLVSRRRGKETRLEAVRWSDGSVSWSYRLESGGGVFTPDGHSIVMIEPHRLSLFAFPDGELKTALPLIFPVRETPNASFALVCDVASDGLYFLDENSTLAHWRFNGECIGLLSSDREPLPPFAMERYEVVSRDGRSVPVLRYIPPQPREVAILFVQGGPPASGTWESIDDNHPLKLRLIAEGFEIIAPAYRGLDENAGEYGGADLQDVLACATDWQHRTGGARPLAIVGYSYGGYLTFLALAQQGIAWAGGIALWPCTGPFGLHAPRWYPAAPQQKALAEIERSPAEQAGKIRAPLMIFVGTLDDEVFGGSLDGPSAAIRTIQERVRGAGVACDLVAYSDDTHGLNRYRDEIHRRLMEFLEGL